MILVQRRDNEPLGHEEKLVWQYATMEGVKVQAFSPNTLSSIGAEKIKSASLVVGSVASIQDALGLMGVIAPLPDYYPQCLREYCHRDVELVTRQEALSCIMTGVTLFVKSHDWKKMTGAVITPKSLPSEFLALEADEEVWVSNDVTWLSEYRVYVDSGVIVAICCYLGDDEEKIDRRVLDEAVEKLSQAGWHDTYAMDWGVMISPEKGKVTALVEMNDAWAIGAYAGIDYRSYTRFLMHRWAQLIASSEE